MRAQENRMPYLRNNPQEGKDMIVLDRFTAVPRLEKPTIRGQDFQPVKAICL